MNTFRILVLLVLLLLFILFTKKSKEGYSTIDKICNLNIIQNQHQIKKNLWLGNYKSSTDIEFLKKNNIKLIINLSKNLDFVDLNDIQKFRIPIHDNLSQESNIGMIKYFDKSYNLVDSYLKKDLGVLIHCRAGMQRSATLTALYLMKKYKISSIEAIRQIKHIRCVAFFIRPNFKSVLNYFDKYN